MQLRLHGRIVALLIGLVLAAQLATFAVVHLATDRSVRAPMLEGFGVREVALSSSVPQARQLFAQGRQRPVRAGAISLPGRFRRSSTTS